MPLNMEEKKEDILVLKILYTCLTCKHGILIRNLKGIW